MPEWKEEISKRLTGLKLASAREAEIVDELAQHLEDRYQELLAGGATRAEAHRMALEELSHENLLARQLRHVERTATQEPVPLGTTETRSIHADLWRDVRYGWRILAKNPSFTAVAVLTLALGIGVNTTIFSLVSSVLLRQPPVQDAERVMMLCSRNPGDVWHPDLFAVSARDFLDWRAQSTAFSDMAAASFDEFTLSGGTEPERVPGSQVSERYFHVLGVPPLLGRTFLPGEDQAGHERVVVLSEDFWRRHFASDAEVIGRSVKVNGENYIVIGVMPSRLRMWLFPAELWMPLVFSPEQLGAAGRRSRFLSVFARLKPGADEKQAQAEMETIAQRIAARYPESNKGWEANVVQIQEYIVKQGNTQTALVFLMATVGFVLLIACANLANLLLARNSARQREFAIRAALGAGRARLARQLLSECLLLALAGGGLGLLLAFWGVRTLRTQLNWSDYAARMAAEISVDWRVLLFTLAVSVAAAMIFGLSPALQVSRPDPNAGLKESARTTTAGREHRRLHYLLVSGEIALSLILLVGAGLFVKLFIEETQKKLGMNPHNLVTASVSLSGAAYKDPARQSAFFENVLRRTESFPEVQSAAVTTDLPSTFPGSVHFTLEGRPLAALDEQPQAGYYVVSPGYFQSAQIPVLQGREFTPSDNASSAPVAIVDQAFARRFFPNEDPLGRHISISRDNAVARQWTEIVGVVGEVKEFLGQAEPRPHVFECFLARPDAAMNFLVRTRTNPGAFAASLRHAVWAVDKDQAVTNFRTMDRVVQDSGQGDDLMARLMGGFAGLALLMAAIGIYGVIAYSVGRRTHEIGVRMALGARRSEVFRLVLRNAMSVALTGVAVGFLISLALPRLVAASFPGFHVHAAWIVAGTPLAVALVALASCYLPARRASHVDPMVALRNE